MMLLQTGIYNVNPNLQYTCRDGQGGWEYFYWVAEAEVVAGQVAEWTSQTPLQVHCPPLPGP